MTWVKIHLIFVTAFMRCNSLNFFFTSEITISYHVPPWLSKLKIPNDIISSNKFHTADLTTPVCLSSKEINIKWEIASPSSLTHSKISFRSLTSCFFQKRSNFVYANTNHVIKFSSAKGRTINHKTFRFYTLSNLTIYIQLRCKEQFCFPLNLIKPDIIITTDM